MMGNPFISVL